MEPIYTPRSIEDLERIWYFIAQDSSEAADSFVGELLRTVERLASFPRMGRARSDLRRGLRSFPHGNYLIFYDVVDERVRVLHFVEGSRNIRKLFRGKR